MTIENVVHDYYDALRRGEPLAPYFHEDVATVKFGVSESLFGPEAIVDGLREQTETTTEWDVDSERLHVDERGEYAVFGDEVGLAWTDRETGERYRFETRWSGTLERVDENWRFVSMHVSAPHRL